LGGHSGSLILGSNQQTDKGNRSELRGTHQHPSSPCSLFQENYRDLRGRIVKQLDRVVGRLANIIIELEDEDEEVA
jgi:hypothetical protein